MSGKRMAPPLRAVAGYGEPGVPGSLVILPPTEYAADYGVTGWGRLGPTGHDLERVTVTDRETGASITAPMGGGQITASLPPDLAPADLARLWSAGRYLAGWSGVPLGRRSKADERIAEIVREAAAMGDGATRQGVAERLGRVDPDHLMHGAYKRDVKAAGGWAEIMRRAAVLRRQLEM